MRLLVPKNLGIETGGLLTSGATVSCWWGDSAPNPLRSQDHKSDYLAVFSRALSLIDPAPRVLPSLINHHVAIDSIGAVTCTKRTITRLQITSRRRVFPSPVGFIGGGNEVTRGIQVCRWPGAPPKLPLLGWDRQASERRK